MEIGPEWYLSEMTDISKEEIIEKAMAEFERMVEEGAIKALITPYGRFIVLDHPLLRDERAYLLHREKEQEVPKMVSPDDGEMDVGSGDVDERPSRPPEVEITNLDDGSVMVRCPSCGFEVHRTQSYYLTLRSHKCPHCLTTFRVRT